MKRFKTFTVISFLVVIFNVLMGCSSQSEEDLPPFPRWIFNHWVWEDEGTQESTISLVKGYLERDIPVGAVIIDSPWETHYNTFEFDPALYPDPASMIEEIHSMDVRVMLWITSMINVDSPQYAEAASRNFFMKARPGEPPKVIEWWKGKGSLLDYFNSEAVQWWHVQMEKVLSLNIDGWKCDGTDFSAWMALYSPGAGRFITRQEYSEAYYRDFYEYTRIRLGPDRIITARPVDNYGTGYWGDEAVFAPVDVNWAGWVGDQDATFEGMEMALNNMLHSSRRGYLAFGSDIGGYREVKELMPLGRSKELFIRWMQLGAFSGVMENGGGGEHRPWMFDDETVDIYRFYTKLRYALLDYLWEEAVESWKKGISIMRFFRTIDYSFYLGDDIVVFPVYKNVSKRLVHFPDEGEWVYILDPDGPSFQGGTTAVVDLSSLWDFPAFVRKGSKAHRTISQFLSQYGTE